MTMLSLTEPKTENFAARLNEATSSEEVTALAKDIEKYLAVSPNDVGSMSLLIKCYIRLNDISHAERILEICYNMNIGNLPIDITIYKAMIQNDKRKHGDAVELLNQRLTDQSLTNDERIGLMLPIAIYEANRGNFNETYKVALDLWHIVKPGSDFNINDKSFYLSIAQSRYILYDSLAALINIIRSYLNGIEYLKDKKYLEIYEYVKKIPDIYAVYPFEEIDIEFPEMKYFIFKVVTKPMSAEERFNFKHNIRMSLKSIYPDEFILIDIIEKDNVSNR